MRYLRMKRWFPKKHEIYDVGYKVVTSFFLLVFLAGAVDIGMRFSSHFAGSTVDKDERRKVIEEQIIQEHIRVEEYKRQQRLSQQAETQ